MLKGEERTNTNERVYEAANAQMREGSQQAVYIQKHSLVYLNRKAKLFQDIVTRDDNDPLRQVTMNADMQPHRQATRRQGRPKRDWTTEAAKQYWKAIQHHIPEHLKDQELDLANNEHKAAILAAAHSKVA
jgi:hypothetical protein